eukprot:1142832-Pelagomonas_calceolata.AAC.6
MQKKQRRSSRTFRLTYWKMLKKAKRMLSKLEWALRTAYAAQKPEVVQFNREHVMSGMETCEYVHMPHNHPAQSPVHKAWPTYARSMP